MFDVESFPSYVQIQAESALRNLAMHHPYDSHDDSQMSLRGQSEAVAEQLRKEVDARIHAAGCEVRRQLRAGHGTLVSLRSQP